MEINNEMKAGFVNKFYLKIEGCKIEGGLGDCVGVPVPWWHHQQTLNTKLCRFGCIDGGSEGNW